MLCEALYAHRRTLGKLGWHLRGHLCPYCGLVPTAATEAMRLQVLDAVARRQYGGNRAAGRRKP